MKYCIIFGASQGGRDAYNILKTNYQVIAFSDNDRAKWGTLFCGVKVIPPHNIMEFKDTEVIIANIHYFEINKQLRNMGIEPYVYKHYINYSNQEEFYKLFSSNVKRDDIIQYINTAENTSVKKIFDQYDSTKKTVLICAYLFPPMGGSGVQRTLKFVKYISKMGWRPIVLTVGAAEYSLIDMSLLKDLPEDLILIRVDDITELPENTGIHSEIKGLYYSLIQDQTIMRDLCNYIGKELDEIKLLPDKNITWVNECLKRITEYIDINKVDAIYTTGNPYSDFFLGFILKNQYGIPWVMDYRDPWTTNDFYLINYHRWDKEKEVFLRCMEERLVKATDHVIVAAEPWKDDFYLKFHIPFEKISEITNGYDEEDFCDLKKHSNSKYTICYNGTIYIDRNPLILLKCINELIDDNRINKGEIQWIFNGELSVEWKRRLDEMDKYGIVKYSGYLEHKQSLIVSINSDLMVMFGAPNEGGKYIYPGKLFEYIRLGNRIINFSGPESITDRLINKFGIGKSFSYTDNKGVKLYLYENYKEWKMKKSIKKNKNYDVKEYSRESETRKLVAILNELVKESK